MDTPHFMPFCFLLLILAALHPNTAMSSENHAEGTQDSSETNVTVYRCKDCESNTCKSSNYEGFEKIGETKNKEFSNQIIQLVTNETHITMCFQQKHALPEGVYGIVWVKATGIGDSCGILNSGAFSENLNGNIIKICCEAEISLFTPNRQLKCDIKRSDEKDRKSTTDVTSEGNLDNFQFLVGEKSNVGIISPIVFIGVCAAALAVYCAWQKRKSQGHVITLHQVFKVNGEKKLPV